jgi:hypothetical protein
LVNENVVPVDQLNEIADSLTDSGESNFRFNFRALNSSGRQTIKDLDRPNLKFW